MEIVEAEMALSSFYANAVVRPGGNQYLHTPDALRLLDFVEERHLRLLGVEGFCLEGSGIRPIRDSIGDFSDTNDSATAILVARNLIHAAPSNSLWDVEIDLNF